jgi:hypothetical protein
MEEWKDGKRWRHDTVWSDMMTVQSTQIDPLQGVNPPPPAGANPLSFDTSASVTETPGLADVLQSSADQVAMNPVVSALLPDALVLGETHGNLPGGIGGALKGGNFALIGFESGQTTYFGARPIQALPDIPSPFGPIKTGLSVVGTSNANGEEAGIGFSAKAPTPAGDVLIFANARGGDGARLRGLIDGQQNGTVSLNFGAAYSVSDGGIMALGSLVPGGAFVASAAATLSGADAWVGAAYRATGTFENGQLTEISIGDVTIPASQLGQFFSQEVGLEGDNIPQNALNIGGILAKTYINGGASPGDAGAWTQATYDGGGLAALTDRTRAVMNQTIPKDASGGANVTNGAFRDYGMGNQAADQAKVVYDQLRSSNTESYSPQEAWGSVWSVYLEGYHRGSTAGQTGLRDGGNSGGLTALEELSFDLAEQAGS